MKRRFLVTGGAGFIGSWVVEHLLDRGDEVTVLDDFSSGAHENLREVTQRATGGSCGLRIIEGSVARQEDVLAALNGGVDGVFHLAARPSVVESVESPRTTHETNATGTVTVLDACRRRGIRVVYAGSSAAYGDDDTVLAKHETLRERPLSPYAADKLAGEMYCRSFATVYDLPVVVLRFFNVFGPRQSAGSPYSGVVAAFCNALLRGEAPRIDGDGEQSRDFVFVDDVARILLAAMDARGIGRCPTWNVATGTARSVNELFETLRTVADRVDLEARRAPARSGDVRHSLADVSRLEDQLGTTARVAFEDGLRRTWAWYRASASMTAR